MMLGLRGAGGRESATWPCARESIDTARRKKILGRLNFGFLELITQFVGLAVFPNAVPLTPALSRREREEKKSKLFIVHSIWRKRAGPSIQFHYNSHCI